MLFQSYKNISHDRHNPLRCCLPSSFSSRILSQISTAEPSRTPRTPHTNRTAAFETPPETPVRPQTNSDNGNMSITINIPAHVAANSELLLMLTPHGSHSVAAPTVQPRLAPLQFAPSAVPMPATASPVSTDDEVSIDLVLHPSTDQCEQLYEEDRILDIHDLVYPCERGWRHPLDPVPMFPTGGCNFYAVCKGTKIGVCYDKWYVC